MLGNIIGSTIGKVVAGGLALLVIGIGFYVVSLQGAIKDRDLALSRQQVTIQAQASTIETLNIQWKLQEAANAVLTERLKTRAVQVEALNSEIEAILKQGIENDGPVAPVLDSIVRAPTTRPRG